MSSFDDLHFGVSSSHPEEDAFCLMCLRLYRISINDRLCPTCAMPLRKFGNSNSNGQSSSNSNSSSSTSNGSSNTQVQSIRALLQQMNQVMYQESERMHHQSRNTTQRASSSFVSSSASSSSSTDGKQNDDDEDDGKEDDDENDEANVTPNTIISRSQLPFSASGNPSSANRVPINDMMEQLLSMTLSSSPTTTNSSVPTYSSTSSSTDPTTTIGLSPTGLHQDPVLLASLESTIQSFMESLQSTNTPNNLDGSVPSVFYSQARVDPSILASLPRTLIHNPATDLPHNYSLQLTVPGNNDKNKTNPSLNIPIEFSALPANFGPKLEHHSLNHTIEGKLVPVEPLNAAVPELTNGNDLTNAIAIVERGVVSFARKAQHVIPYKAQGLIVINGKNMAWPYTMTDSTGEGSSIPLVMVRYEDGERLLSYIRTNPSCHGKLIAAPSSETCPICYDTFTTHSTVLTLPCQHIFDEVCGLKWLETHNSCPICRSTLPTVANNGTDTPVTDGNTTNSHLFAQLQNDVHRQRQQQSGNRSNSSSSSNGWYQ